MILSLRILRALSGVLAIIMFKASFRSAFDLFAGESNSTELLSLHVVLTLAFSFAFFRLRELVNNIHSARTGSGEPLLNSVTKL